MFYFNGMGRRWKGVGRGTSAYSGKEVGFTVSDFNEVLNDISKVVSTLGSLHYYSIMGKFPM